VQVGVLEMLWDTENGRVASVPEQQSRLEREREIACYLLMVSHLLCNNHACLVNFSLNEWWCSHSMLIF